jgi:hypothetical protein
MAGNLLAELVNFSPFPQHMLRSFAKIADRSLCRLYFVEFPGLQCVHGAFKLQDRFFVKPLCNPQHVL